MHGFSPYQIVYGKKPNLPSNIINKPLAISEVMKRHHTGLQEARKTYLATESSERIKRELRKQKRPKGEEFKQGEKVFFFGDGGCGGKELAGLLEKTM